MLMTMMMAVPVLAPLMVVPVVVMVCVCGGGVWGLRLELGQEPT